VWTYIVALIAGGAVLGLAGGYLIAAIVSAIISGQTGVAMQASIGSGELLLVGALVICGAVLASLPALLIYNRPVVDGLRA
jgi:putative ABC transport system permease protein